MVDIHLASVECNGIKLHVEEDGREIARTFIYFLSNGLHERPFAFIEDVFVDEMYRGRGIGSDLLEEAIAAAKDRKCYKIICTSRHQKEKVHGWYEKRGFRNHGLEFRMDFD